jgi:pyruvyl transferase EpsO
VKRLQEECGRQLDAVLQRNTGPVALVDVPNYANVGDSAIWLGELAYLASRRIQVAYTCDKKTYSARALARALRNGGTILLQGGGNFGDLWRDHHALRERVISEFPDLPIIQLPQTIHFQSSLAHEQSRKVLNRHRHLMLLLRDTRSLALARQSYDVPSALCPDAAFCLGTLQRPSPPSREQLWLWREDSEAAGGEISPLQKENEAVRIADWLSEPPSILKTVSRRMTRAAVRYPRAFGWMRDVTPRTFHPLATGRLERGCQLLSEGKVVVTNRLHGHILCTLMGIPHVVLDNSYGKLSTFVETWQTLGDTSVFASSAAEALRAARMLVGGSV